LRRWLRHVESLRETEEVVHICEPKVGKTHSDEEEKRSKDLMNCQERSDENSYCLVGNEMRSIEDLIGLEEDSYGNSYCQVDNEMGSMEDLIDG
jgi:hypothetical protein